ncbi:hypothetical protein ES703_125710 [subsurface metagenome]
MVYNNEKERRPKCLTVLKMVAVVGRVCQGVVVEVQIQEVAHKVALVVDRVAVRVKGQGEKDSLPASRSLGGIKRINAEFSHFLLLRRQKRESGVQTPDSLIIYW